MVKTYKCPGCGGELVYAPGTGNLSCPHCGKTCSVQEVEEKEKGGQTIGLTAREGQDDSGNGLKEFKCPSCGAVLVTDEYSAALSCAYCGSPALIESRLTGEFSPKWVLPFGFNKKQSQEYFKKWKGTGLLTPGTFKSNATMDKVTGVYVPYWLFDYMTETHIAGEGRKKEVERSGEKETETIEVYEVEQDSRATFRKVPVKASDKMDDAAMKAMEPFDYSQMKEFSMPYLSGFTAEMYNHSGEEYAETVKAGLTHIAVEAARESVQGFDEVDVLESEVKFSEENFEYAMLPVWMLNFMYGGKSYPLFMNGQNGKIYGTLPTSKGRVLLVFLIAFAIFFLIALLIGGGLS